MVRSQVDIDKPERNVLTDELVADLKLGHYMKVPPRTPFACQVAVTIWAAFKDHFTCPSGRTLFSSSIVWGLTGPQRMFGAGIYHMSNFFWLLSALLPIAFWLILRVWPCKKIRWIHAPVILGALGWLPPATPSSLSSWAIAGFIFSHWIRRRFHGWWTYHNYLTAAALDCGVLIAKIVVYLAITLPNVTVPQWWGNVQVFETMNALGTAARKTVADGETFSPQTW
ncbi:hypothetical protein AC579_7165 [Pseudocercospora musae]|uniref:OPT family small oligopeptide transporter n=1 Tax=Pseudocercospora musae TaxID=113226 RepID=A0A139I876_9PEZI|nr:hypothetical protein AC579_7165 [Pseudocercospora musae]